MTSAVQLEPQPDFPNVDLTQQNADALELLLANKELLASFHVAAERSAWKFRVGHPAVRACVKHVYQSGPRLKAAEHGIVLYEAIAGLLNSASAGLAAEPPANAEALRISRMPRTRAIDYMTSSVQHIRGTPLLHYTVQRISEKQHPHEASFAILGAAITRQFDLNVAMVARTAVEDR